VGPAWQSPHPSPLFPFSSSLYPGAGQPSRPCSAGLTTPARAGRGAAGPPSRHAHRGPVRARGRIRKQGGVKDPTTLSTEHPRRIRAPTRAPPAPPGERPRVWRAFPPRAARGFESKGPGRRGTDAKPPTPSWCFLFHHRPVCTGLGEEAGAPPPRRAGQGRSRKPSQNRSAYTARDAAARGKERRSFASVEGAGPEQGTVRRRERL
jgi:hypothetical protein